MSTEHTPLSADILLALGVLFLGAALIVHIVTDDNERCCTEQLHESGN